MTLSVSFSVVSNSLQPHGLYVAHQAPLSLGILQARILEWVSMPSSCRSSQPRDQNQVSFIASRLFTLWGTREAPVMTFSSVQSLSHAWLFVTPWIVARQASLSITNSQSLLKLMPIESVMPSSHLILCCPLLLLPQSLPASGSFPMSQLFASGGQSIGVSTSASVLPMNIQDWSPLGWTG